ncbi:MAG: flagellar basal body rod protein FlgB [Planctomycetota bacterium]
MLDLAKLLDVAALRSRVHASNIANQNTPGYRARAVAFEDAFQDAWQRDGAAGARAVEAEVFEPRTTRVDNDGNDVSVDKEVAEMAQNAMLYNAYVAMYRGKSAILTQAIREGG